MLKKIAIQYCEGQFGHLKVKNSQQSICDGYKL